MKVLYFLPDIEAGVSTIVRAIIKYSPKPSGIKYEVVLYRGEGDLYKAAVSDFGDARVHRVHFSHDENIYAVFKKMRSLITSDKDIIVANDGLELRMVTALKLKNPVMYIIHGDYDYYYKLIKLNKTIINTVITYSTCIYDKVAEMFPERKGTVKKIYYPAAFIDEIDTAYAKPAGFNILFAGLLIERKGAHLLRKIYDACIALGVKDFSVTIIGNGEFYDTIEKDFYNKPNVKVMGWQPAQVVHKEMKKAHVFLFPSNAEGLPNVVVEALSCGAVPVATNIESGIKDIITDHTNGMLVEKQDSALFAEALSYLYNNRAALQGMSKSAMEGLQKFNPAIQASLYHEAAMESLALCENAKRLFPTYSMGRLLNKSWLPNRFVKLSRQLIKHHKI